jgi:hypothetical protein
MAGTHGEFTAMQIRALFGRRVRGITLAILALTVVACIKSSRSGASKGDSDAAERLRSLPYVGFSSEKVSDKSGVVHHEKERAAPGYNLFTSRDLCTADLVDMEGKIVNSWSSPDCERWTHVVLLPEGDIVVAGMKAVGSEEERREESEKNAYLLRMTWDGKQVWQIPMAAHHDVSVTPAGTLVTLTMRQRMVPEYDPNIPIRDNGIARVSMDGKVLETASLYDLLTTNPAEFTLQRVKKAENAKVQEIDLFHCNTVEFMRPELAALNPLFSVDNVLVTIRHQDTMAIIDWPKKKLIWAWGQGVLSGPHDGKVLPSGNILVFDNGLNRGWSRAVEMDPVARKIVWEYKAPNPKDLFTVGRGAVQRLANGDTLITDSDHGRAFEVTSNGEIVWDFFNPRGDKDNHRATIHRMNRYASDFIHAVMARVGAHPPTAGSTQSAPARGAEDR